MRAFFIAALLLALWPACARADLVNTNGADLAPNFAEVTILDDRVRVGIEIDLPDYPAFVPAGAEAVSSRTEPDPETLSKTTGAAFAVRGADGNAIEPDIRDIQVRDRTPRLDRKSVV